MKNYKTIKIAVIIFAVLYLIIGFSDLIEGADLMSNRKLYKEESLIRGVNL